MARSDLDWPRFRPRYQPLVSVAGALAAGIVADRWLAIAFAGTYTFGFVGIAVWYWLHRQRREFLAGATLLFAISSVGAAWHHLCWCCFDRYDLSVFASEEFRPVIVDAVAREAPRRVAAPPFDPMNAIPRGERSRLEIDALAIRHGDAWHPAVGRALLTVDGELTGIEAGDRLRITGALALPPPPLNPGTFHYPDYLRAMRIRAVLFAEDAEAVQIVDQATGLNPRRWLGRVRGTGERDLQRHLSKRGASLAAVLLLNAREQLETSRSEAFLETGTIHHLAISGTHVGVLAATLFAIMRVGMLPRRFVLTLIALIVVLYALVTGGEAPVLRAMTLVLIVCLALLVGRRPLGYNSLGAAAICVLAWNPTELFDVGAQLSFLSVAVLIHVARHWIEERPVDALDRLVAETRPWPVRALRAAGRGTWQIVAVSAAVWLVTMPLIMARFHLASPISVALNPLLWLPVAVALLSGFAVLVFGWIPPIGIAAGWLCDRSLTVTEWGVSRMNELPGGHLYVPGPSDAWLAVFYLGAAAVALFPRVLTPLRRVALLGLWICVGVAPRWYEAQQEQSLRCHFFAVGHGSAVLIELPDGRRILYDAGQLGLPSAAARTIADALWWHGVTHLDALVISHADVDHYCAVPHLLKRFSFGKTYVSPTMFARDVDAVRALRIALRDFGVTTEVIDARFDFRVGDDVTIEVLHPPRGGIAGSDNANSLVLLINYQGRRILLTGDLEPPGLKQLLNAPPLDCDVLMAPHHGSGGSDPPGLIDWCSPEHVIISGSRRDVSPRVTEAYAARGAQVLHTAIDGAVTVVVENGTLQVTAFRQ